MIKVFSLSREVEGLARRSPATSNPTATSEKACLDSRGANSCKARDQLWEMRMEFLVRNLMTHSITSLCCYVGGGILFYQK
ncbi:hypothetical protein J2S74_002011 [Evansella vedderi]|uniref:Uncharacterized protein n=1 Tax=Evansella vedderi TaxID=38282 RepID=A0ABT9ZTR2_9BACI|nr:hypothetical protein [Evansella vedderi]